MKKIFVLFFLLATIVLFSGHAFAQTYAQTADLNITAPTNFDLNSQFTIVLDVNSAITSQVTDNVDFNDLSPHYLTTPLQRRVEKYGTNARIYFRVPEGLTIPAGTSNLNFNLKYGSDSNISSPAINDANVFQRWFDFNTGAIPSNILTGNASVQNQKLQLTDGVAWGDSYAFIDDLNFNRDWAAVFESDINIGVAGGHLTGFNNGHGTTNNDMINAFGGTDGSQTLVTIQEDGNNIAALNGIANTTYTFRAITKNIGSWYSLGTAGSIDYNNIHQSFVNGFGGGQDQLMVRAGTTLTPSNNQIIEMDNLKVYYDANWFGATINFSDINATGAILSAGINASPSQGNLDPENSVTSVDVNFFSTTSLTNASITNYDWYLDGALEQSGTGSDLEKNLTTPADYNVSLIVTGTNNSTGEGLHSQADLNYLVRNLPQGIDITFSNNIFSNNIDINFMVSSSGTINYAVWGFPNDQNLTGINVNKTYSTEGTKQVCVIVNGTGDVNKLACESFVATRFLVHPPKDEETNTSLTPFTIIGDAPNQTYSNQSSDLNVFTFYKTASEFRLNIDYNALYYTRNLFYDLNTSTFFFDVQPYVALKTSSIQSVIFTIDNLSRTSLPNVLVQSYRDINGTSTLIESGISDESGTVTFSFLTEPTYTLYFYVDGELLSSGDIVAKSTTLYAFVFTGTISSSPSPLPKILVTWSSTTTSILSDSDNNSFLSQLITYADTNISNIHVSVYSSDLNIFTKDFNGLGSGDWNISYDFNTSDVNQFNFVNVRVLVQTTTDGNFTFTKTYIIVFSGSQSILNNFKNIKGELGNTSVLVVSILISLGLAAFVAMRVTTDPAWLGIFVILVTGFFVYISWLPFNEWVIASLGGIALMFWSWRR